jgi:hypothetical protein
MARHRHPPGQFLFRLLMPNEKPTRLPHTLGCADGSLTVKRNGRPGDFQKICLVRPSQHSVRRGILRGFGDRPLAQDGLALGEKVPKKCGQGRHGAPIA